MRAGVDATGKMARPAQLETTGMAMRQGCLGAGWRETAMETGISSGRHAPRPWSVTGRLPELTRRVGLRHPRSFPPLRPVEDDEFAAA